MVGPARKREAVTHVCQRLEVSERRVCESLEQPRSTQRYVGKRKQGDAELLTAIRRIATREPRAGYRSVARYLRREGWRVNDKRVHRLWKQEGLKVTRKAHKRRRMGQSENGIQKLKSERINHVWSYDFVFDQTEGGSRLKWLAILDEYTRELICLEVESSITSERVIELLERLVAQRGAPEYLRSDNGPEFIARAVKKWIESEGFKTLYIEPGAPWQNAYSESFNSRFRDEFLNVESFSSKLEAKILGKEHQYKYNHYRPHSSLGEQTPAEFAKQCLASLRATPFTALNIAINPNQQPNLS